MLQLYNTMSRRKEAFIPLQDGEAKMFTCGPSIYGRPHVGNYRSFLWEDVLQRYLEYSGYRVERVLNFTDVEDKAIAEAEKEGATIEDLTSRNADQFFEDVRLLRIKLPNHIPRSSTSVEQAVKLIQILLEKEYAYWHENNVFFDPLKFEGFGKLFRLDMSRWPKVKKRFKRDTYPGRRWNLGDFILWHGHKPGDKVYWDTDIGKGRPAWNIQDPAMITRHLGFAIDISCGGIDNIYRHHDYNIAVIEAVSGKEFSRYWVHGEHLLVDGKKMSKSVGNILYPADLLKEGYSAEHIRFYLLYGHHRKQLNLTKKNFQDTVQKLDAFREKVKKLASADSPPASSGSGDEGVALRIGRQLPGFEKCMDNDLDIKGAFDALSEGLSHLVSLKQEGKLSRQDRIGIERDLRKADEVLQFIYP